MQAALTIRNPIARALARELAELRRVSITDAVVEALQAELARERAAAPLEDQLAALADRVLAKAGQGGRIVTEDERDAMWTR